MKPIQTAITACLILFLLFLTSCIDLTQDIEINPDRSGRYSLTVDLGILKYFPSETFSGTSEIIRIIQDLPAQATESLQGQKGISEIENISREEYGVYGIRFKFDNDKSLNKAMYGVADKQKLMFMPDFIRIKRKKVTITNISPYIRQAVSIIQKNSAQSFLTEQMSQYINITTRLHLPREAKQAQNQRTKIEQHTATLKSTLSELLKGADYGNVVKY